MTDSPALLDAEVLKLCREAGASVVTVRRLAQRLPGVTVGRLHGSLDRLEREGCIGRRFIRDGRRTKKREYVVTSKGRGE